MGLRFGGCGCWHVGGQACSGPWRARAGCAVAHTSRLNARSYSNRRNCDFLIVLRITVFSCGHRFMNQW